MPFRQAEKLQEAAPRFGQMKISNDKPFYYLTSVTNNRLPVFRTDKLKDIIAKAFDEARNSAEILIFAYVIMSDHYHLITDGSRAPSEVSRYFNGIAARRVIGYLKDNKYESSLNKLRQETKKREYKYSLWDHHSNVFSINNEMTLMQKVNYIHQNPIKAGFVEKTDDYLYSSARFWHRKPLENEPLTVDIDKIEWREAQPRQR